MSRKKLDVICPLDHENSIELVLGGGGAKGPAHLGALTAIEERRINISMVTGISIGSAAAAWWTNGFSVKEMRGMLIKGMNRLNPFNPDRTLLSPGPFSIAVGAKRLINLHRLYTELVDRYGIKPNPRLRILAFDVMKGEPVVFQGTDYDLATALAASCAIPGVMAPVWLGQADKSGLMDIIRAWWNNSDDELLVDGGVTDFDPSEFCHRPCLISRIGYAHRWPADPLPWFPFLWHMGEMIVGSILDRHFKEPPGNHIVMRVGPPDVCALAFGLPPERCDQIAAFGYHQAAKVLDRALSEGRLPVRRT